MKRLREMDVAASVKACVIAGPADLMSWQVSACVDSDGMSLDVIGRGSDLEAAAASAMAVLTENGATLGAPLEMAATTPLDEGGLLAAGTGGNRRHPSQTIWTLEQGMHLPATRVVYRNQPYLVESSADGSVVAAFGPFTPGTEPSLVECRADNQVQDAELLDRLTSLVPISPDLPAAADTLAGG